eukprot:COSAG01_NODE_21053_length_920_cov_3.130329_2_plen_90_part_01
MRLSVTCAKPVGHLYAAVTGGQLRPSLACAETEPARMPEREALLDVCVKREWQSIQMFRHFQLLEAEVFVADGDFAATEEQATGLERRAV